MSMISLVHVEMC